MIEITFTREELQYYNFSHGEDLIVDARSIYELAEALESL